MADLVPELREQYELARQLELTVTNGAVAQFFATADFRGYYADYLFRKSRTQVLLLETNNLLIDLRAGVMSILEGFKKTHRYIDVLKADQEFRIMKSENRRRRKLIGKGNLGDPDVDKVTVVTGAKTIDGVNVSVLEAADSAGSHNGNSHPGT
jgi:hypothetical protein